MTTLLLLVLAASIPAAEADAQEKANPVYRQLRRQGVGITEKQRQPLPAPVLPDALDARAQRGVLKKLLADDVDLDEFLRESVSAPHLLNIPDQKKGDQAAPARTLDLYFVAHGDLKTLADKDFLGRLFGGERKEGKGKTLTAEELKQRGITIGEEAGKHESYGYLTVNILDRVQVRAVGHSYWSRDGDSIVFAAELDERFARDPEFPNQWRSLEKADEGQLKEGPPNPYHGAGYYVKITRLKEPAGALFVEAHVVFTEPVKWFDGANLLRSKLPPAATRMERDFRRELSKAGK
jgi:hypothetical protein